MKYVRTFTIHASHFNTGEEYRLYKEGMRTEMGNALVVMNLLKCIKGIHGHNFKITIEVKGTVKQIDGNGWLIDDQSIEKLVREWDRTNLSVHPDFADYGFRATTEVMVRLLLAKLHTAFAGYKFKFKVKVAEDDNIYAEDKD